MVIYAYLCRGLAHVSFASFVPKFPLFALGVFNYLFVGRLDGLLYKVDEIGWAKFAEC